MCVSGHIPTDHILIQVEELVIRPRLQSSSRALLKQACSKLSLWDSKRLCMHLHSFRVVRSRQSARTSAFKSCCFLYPVSL